MTIAQATLYCVVLVAVGQAFQSWLLFRLIHLQTMSKIVVRESPEGYNGMYLTETSGVQPIPPSNYERNGPTAAGVRVEGYRPRHGRDNGPPPTDYVRPPAPPAPAPVRPDRPPEVAGPGLTF